MTKKIIDGRMYNTETATCVAVHSNGCNYGDFRYEEEALYIKKNGEWFLHGEGGPMSGYAVRCGSDECGSSTIIPYTEEEVKDWLCRHNFVDEYIKYFGEPEE